MKEEDIISLVLFLFSVSLSLLVVPLCKKMLEDAGITRENYKGEKIPTSLGVVLVLNTLLIISLLFVIYLYLYPAYYYPYIYTGDIFFIFFFFLPIIGFLGLLDDFVGVKDKKGFRGHFKAFFKIKITSGFIKAFFGFLISVIVCIFIFFEGDKTNLVEMFISAIIVSLSTNFFNLLDLRPGRAIKMFCAVIFCLLKIQPAGILGVSAILGGTLLVYSFYDLRGKAMMGDVGSNVLGFVIGVLVVINFSFFPKIFILGGLILFHIWGEFYSLSEVIEKNKVLRFLDKLGT